MRVERFTRTGAIKRMIESGIHAIIGLYRRIDTSGYRVRCAGEDACCRVHGPLRQTDWEAREAALAEGWIRDKDYSAYCPECMRPK